MDGTIAILGGTGDLGAGLALRWAAAGRDIVIGSRSDEKAVQAAADLSTRLPAGASRPLAPVSGRLSGADNLSAARQARIVILAVPYSAQADTLENVREALAGKLLLTAVVPLQPPKVSHVWRPPAGSAAQEAQAQCGAGVRVVAAFHNVSAALLAEIDHPIEGDVLVCGDSKEDKALVMELARLAGMRAIDAGPLQNASVAEGLTAVLIGINRRHQAKHAGIRLTGLANGE